MVNLALGRKNREIWAAAQEAVPGPPRASSTWEGRQGALRVLSSFAASGAALFLLPNGGHVDVEEVRPSREPGCVELVLGERRVHILKPVSVSLERFPEAPLETFLMVELDELEPSGVYDEVSRPDEELLEADGEYHEREHWDEDALGEDEDGEPLPLPEDARLVVRWLSGKVMVVARGSVWSNVPRTYGLHARHEAHEIRAELARILEKLGPDYLESAPAA